MRVRESFGERKLKVANKRYLDFKGFIVLKKEVSFYFDLLEMNLLLGV